MHYGRDCTGFIAEMRHCPKCQHQVSETAKACPGCGEDFAERKRQEATTRALSIVILLALLAIAGLVILSPGIIINALRGRYKNSHRNFLVASLTDWQTYLISLPIAAVVFMVLSLSGAFDRFSDKNMPLAQRSAPRVIAEEPDANQQEIRRAIPVTATPPTEMASTPNSLHASAQPTGTAQARYSVFGVAPGDTLNVRSGPGAQFPIIERLSNGFDGVRVVGPTVVNQTTEWINIGFGERTGWVNKQYLKAQ